MQYIRHIGEINFTQLSTWQHFPEMLESKNKFSVFVLNTEHVVPNWNYDKLLYLDTVLA